MSDKDTKISSIDDALNTPSASKPAAPKKAVKGQNHDVALSGKTRTITVHTSEAEGGHEAVFLSINGFGYQIPRGIPVEVPEEVLQVLENAKTTSYHPGDKAGEFVERTAHRFAFSAH
ncbi:hypothetical protein [Polynucleobacter sp. UK-Kesae-W10]|uniref:hypothetical protein n=1 Tax=Polynucleobacter sp. UK-Kesae-W10 TaxID=1819738 RepID=UPI001C0E6C33|nr:hypothetical protein [Polynucleobacter sp. UK-Kesae-W10]MBU3577577.1 hypothetical protein [Polynucleobacter sp. UK-Kesae-W10]